MTGQPEERPTPLVDPGEIRQNLVHAVRRVCPAVLRSEEEDLVQMAMLRVMRGLERGQELHRSYLYRTAWSVSVDMLRRRKVRPQVAEEAVSTRTHVSTAAGPDDHVAAVELREALRRCIESTAASRRDAITLHLVGHRLAEIAERLGFSKKKAENLVYRGMKDVRPCLRDKGFEP